MGGVNDFIGRGETVFLLRDANSTLSGAGGVLCVYCHLRLAHLDAERVYLSPGRGWFLLKALSPLALFILVLCHAMCSLHCC